ncbi:hypothetical protein ACFPK5_01090 [Streptomyces beijiangensis]|uniref:hypothetical protein n=1 Tax=Streptomyces beijiangensis TaxID=163361 RepID=UPI00360E3595
MQPGTQVMLQRGDLTLTYTVAGPEALASIVEHPEAIAHARRPPADRSEHRLSHAGRAAR